MDLYLLGGLVTTLAGGVAVVVGALAAYQKATASRAEERGLLVIVWDSLEHHEALWMIPARARRRIAEIVRAAPAEPTEEESDDAPNSADA